MNRLETMHNGILTSVIYYVDTITTCAQVWLRRGRRQDDLSVSCDDAQ